MVQKHIVISMIAPVAVAGILIMTILAATANAQEDNNAGNPQQPVAGCGPGTDNSTCSTTPNQQQVPAAAPTAGCGPGTDNSTCSTTPNQQRSAAPTAGCGPGTDNSTCSTTPNQQQVPAAPTAGCGPGTDNSTCPTNSTPSPSTPTTPTADCGPGTDNSTCKTTTPSIQPTNLTAPTNSTGIAEADLTNIILTVHNRERAAFGVSPLVWSNKLAADAKTWADHIGQTEQFVHCGDTPGCDTHGEGENIAWGGPASATDVGALVASLQDGWVSEKRDYHGTGLPNFNMTIGHWWEMVTPRATEVGCGIALNGHVLVCRYAGDFRGPL